jgi:hypothetical protein
MPRPLHGPLTEMPPVPVVPVRASLPPYSGPEIAWPPGWNGLWTKVHAMPEPRLIIPGAPAERTPG